MKVQYPFLDPRIQIVIKDANETVENSSTLQDDDHLFVEVKANRLYLIYLLGTADLSSGVTADIKFGLSVPGGTVYDFVHAFSSSVVTSTINLNFNLTTTLESATFQGIVHVGATPGTLQVQWAQRAATLGVITTLYKGTYILVIELGDTPP